MAPYGICRPVPGTLLQISMGYTIFATQERTFGIGLPYSLIKLTVLNNYCIHLVGLSLLKKYGTYVGMYGLYLVPTSFVLEVSILSSKKRHCPRKVTYLPYLEQTLKQAEKNW